MATPRAALEPEASLAAPRWDWRAWPARLARPPLWATLIACAAVLLARKPDMLFNPQFWAEDGWFYRSARIDGLGALTMTSAGYLHSVPRLIAMLAALFDPRFAPAVFVWSALVFTLYVAARTQSARCPLPRHVACALAVVLVPDAFEVLLNVVNLQWVLAGGVLLLLISADGRSARQHAHDGIAAVLLGLTGPFSLVFAPLFAWRAWTRRTTASIVLAAIVGVCGLVQWIEVLHDDVVHYVGTFAPDALLAVPGMRITASLLVGTFVPLDYPRLVESVLGLVALAAVAALAQCGENHRAERRWIAAAFVLLLASSLYRVRVVLPELCHFFYGQRYFYPLQLIVLWLLLAATADPRRWVSRTAWGVLLWALVLNVPRLREPPFADLRWPVYAAKIRAGEAIDVPINPRPAWVIPFPARTN
jgi:hypothetical protein